MAPLPDLSRVAGGLATMIALTLAWPPGLAQAEPTPQQLCTISDERLAELSGLAADGQHIYAANDGGSALEVFVLDQKCAVQRSVTGDIDPYDIEDMALAADGTLWLADTGDNRKQRETVALHALAPDGTASLHRLTYPDGQHDAEALLLDREGVPHIVTKHVLGRSGVYRPEGELASPGPTPLEKVAEVSIAATRTKGGPVGAASSVLLTGGAVSKDGDVIALRTYTDVYLYAAPDGDVVAALAGEPVRIPLPDEEQGEAIAFTPDGALLSASEGAGQPMTIVGDATALVSAPPTSQPPIGGGSDGGTGETQAEGGAAPRAAEEADTAGGVAALPGIVIAVGTVSVAWFGLSRLRRRRTNR
ncbi:MAG: hypothetical protein GEU86_12380 [Actinophytocola sp.]|nr:hypothetical protein [Actinophytocola sp.]